MQRCGGVVVALLVLPLLCLSSACSDGAGPELPSTPPAPASELPQEPGFTPSPTTSTEQEPNLAAPQSGGEDGQAVVAEPGTLRQMADEKGMLLGTYFTPECFPMQKWREVVAREFSAAMLYRCMAWVDVEPVQGGFDFTSADEQVQFALANNMTVCSHLICPTESQGNPGWLTDSRLSRDGLEEMLRVHISTVLNRYRGKVGLWLVVEEAYLKGHTDPDFLYRKFGYDYLELVYRFARDADPSAKLLYNDYDNHTAGGATTGLSRQVVQRLKDEGLIDGVGLEMHLDAREPPGKQDMVATMQSYGLPVYVTELDIDMSGVPGAREARYALQSEMYRDVFEACLESGVCRGFMVWGIGDRYSWLERASSEADPTLFDDELNPKPAYFAILEAAGWTSGSGDCLG